MVECIERMGCGLMGLERDALKSILSSVEGGGEGSMHTYGEGGFPFSIISRGSGCDMGCNASCRIIIIIVVMVVMMVMVVVMIR